jgi:hypothetical protein
VPLANVADSNVPVTVHSNPDPLGGPGTTWPAENDPPVTVATGLEVKKLNPPLHVGKL